MAEETVTTTPEEPQTEAASEGTTVAPAAEAKTAEAPAAPPAQRVPERGPTDLVTELQGPEEDGPLKEVPNGRSYEITYIVRPNDPEALASTQTRLKALVETVEGSVDNVRLSGSRRLAYPINKVHDGVYVVVNARFEKGLVEELDRFFKLDESVLRHIVLRKDA